MATVIDELVVTLGLDPKKFTDGQKAAIASFKKTQEEARKQTKDTEEIARRNAETMSAATNKVLGFIAAWAGLRAISGYIQNITNMDAEVGRASVTLETSVRDLAAWRGAAQRTGGSAEGMTASLRGLVQQFQTFSLTGESSVIPWFRALGVQVSDDTGRMRAMNDIMLDLADKFKSLGPARAAAFGSQLGFDQGTINLLIQGRSAVEALLRQQGGLGVTSPEDAKRAQDLQNQWLDLAQATTALVRELSADLVPAVTAFLKSITFGLSWWRTPEARARADAEGDKLTQNLRDRAGGGPADVDAWLRSKLGGTGGFLVPLAQWLSGAPAESSAAGGAGVGAPPAVTLRIKPGAQGGGASHAGTMKLAETLQSEIPGLNRFTSFNDAAHGGRSSAHNRGLALDFSLNDPAQASAVAQQIRAKLAALGINATVVDEYSRPSPFSTGGHIHVQFNSAGDAQRFQAGGGASPASAAAQLGAPTPGAAAGASTSNSTNVNISSITVNTQATDARGIAGSLALETAKAWATQANYGPSG